MSLNFIFTLRLHISISSNVSKIFSTIDGLCHRLKKAICQWRCLHQQFSRLTTKNACMTRDPYYRYLTSYGNSSAISHQAFMWVHVQKRTVSVNKPTVFGPYHSAYAGLCPESHAEGMVVLLPHINYHGLPYIQWMTLDEGHRSIPIHIFKDHIILTALSVFVTKLTPKCLICPRLLKSMQLALLDLTETCLSRHRWWTYTVLTTAACADSLHADSHLRKDSPLFTWNTHICTYKWLCDILYCAFVQRG